MEPLFILWLPVVVLVVVLLGFRVEGGVGASGRGGAKFVASFVGAAVVLSLVVAAYGSAALPFDKLFLIYIGFAVFPLLGVTLGANSAMARESLIYWFLLVPLGGFAGVALAFWFPLVLGVEH
ncbi:MAG: hypothetical protein K8J08_02640 [Thermoanaerobaculia bacterium]|nr:hypothetical protein [Thermoanaerobaculia bacterium]